MRRMIDTLESQAPKSSISVAQDSSPELKPVQSAETIASRNAVPSFSVGGAVLQDEGTPKFDDEDDTPSNG